MMNLIEEKSRQIKNGIFYLFPIVISSLIPILTLPIFTRILSKEDYGVLALAQIYAIFASGLANFGMTASYDRNYFQYRDNRLETGKLLYSTILFVILNFLLLAALTYLFKGALSKLIIGSAEHANILFWAFCAQFFTSLNYYYLAYYKNSELAKKNVFYTITGSLIFLIISLYLVVYLRIGVIGIVYAQLCSGTLVFAVLTYKFTQTFSIKFSKPIFIESLKIGYPLTPKVFLGVISSQFDKYMIGLLASIGGVGIYSIGQRIANGIFIYITAIHKVYSPQVYKRMFDLGEQGGKSVGKYLTPFLYSSVAIGLAVSLFAEEIVCLLTPKSFHEATNIIIILSMYYASLFLGTVPQLTFVKKTHLSSALSVVSITLNILINIPFIMKWGAIGAAWATLLAGLLSGTVTFIVSQRYYEIKWEYKKMAYIFMIFFGSAVTMILLRDANISYGIRLIVKIISLSGYLYLGMKLDILTKQNYLLIKNIIIPAKDGIRYSN